MTTASENRKKNLKEWIDESFGGTVADFCRYYKMSPSFASYLSQILNGVKPLGERAARRLEEQTGRPAFWLDRCDAAPSPDLAFRFDNARCTKLPSQDKELVERFIELLLARHEASRTGSTVHPFRLRDSAQEVASLAESPASPRVRQVASRRTMNINERTEKGRKRRQSK